jgi:hypothetical protein
MFEKNSLITLGDNNEYVVVDKYIENDITYVFLVDINNNSNIIYGKVDGDDIVVISDPDELKSIIKKIDDDLHVQ